MKILIAWFLSIAFLALAFNIPSTEVYAVEVLSLDQRIDKYAQEYHVNPLVVRDIMDCENAARDPLLQSNLHYTKDHPEWGVKRGDRELSFGLVQIHLPSHKNVTYEQATDIDFSIKFLVSNLADGRGSMWSCYK